MSRNSHTRTAKLNEIELAVNLALGVDPAEMVSRSRVPVIIRARQVFIIVARARTHASYPEIAMYVSHAASHSTAITAHQRATATLEGPESERRTRLAEALALVLAMLTRREVAAA